MLYLIERIGVGVVSAPLSLGDANDALFYLNRYGLTNTYQIIPCPVDYAEQFQLAELDRALLYHADAGVSAWLSNTQPQQALR